MYAGIWRLIPGPWIVKLIVMLALFAAAAYGLIFYAYPWVLETFFPTIDVTVPQE